MTEPAVTKQTTLMRGLAIADCAYLTLENFVAEEKHE